MKSFRPEYTVLVALLGCSSGPVDLGNPNQRDLLQQNPPQEKIEDNSPIENDPTEEEQEPSLPSAETVVDATSVPAIATAQGLAAVDGKLYYRAAVDDVVSLYRYDLTTKENSRFDVLDGTAFVADEAGIYFTRYWRDNRPAVAGMPLTSTQLAPQWFSYSNGHATAIALDSTNIYWVAQADGVDFFHIAPRGSFSTSPTATGSSYRYREDGTAEFRSIVAADGEAYAATASGALVRFDRELVTLVLEAGGPTGRFVADASNLYWIDGTSLKVLPKSASQGTQLSTLVDLPANATNTLAGVGAKGLYCLSQPTSGSANGSVLRIDVTTAAKTELATKLPALREGVFSQNAVYFSTSQGILRLADN